MDELLERALAPALGRRAVAGGQVAVEVLAGHDVYGQRAPLRRKGNVALFEDGLAPLVADGRVALHPFQLIEGMTAGGGEDASDPEAVVGGGDGGRLGPGSHGGGGRVRGKLRLRSRPGALRLRLRGAVPRAEFGGARDPTLGIDNHAIKDSFSTGYPPRGVHMPVPEPARVAKARRGDAGASVITNRPPTPSDRG
jgi:hypothetical protein